MARARREPRPGKPPFDFADVHAKLPLYSPTMRARELRTATRLALGDRDGARREALDLARLEDARWVSDLACLAIDVAGGATPEDVARGLGELARGGGRAEALAEHIEWWNDHLAWVPGVRGRLRR